MDDLDTIDDESDSETEVIGPFAEPADSLDALSDSLLPTLSARIWNACCWPERMADGWKMGDFKFIIIETFPEPNTILYVQFWSEPGEPVLMEVCSGEWSPPSVKYVQRRQRELLRSLGFTIGGEARNFQKEIAIANVAQAEHAAREALRILFDGFGYRGQWPLQLSLERDERASPEFVHMSLTREDLAKLLAEHGYPAVVPADGDPNLVVARRGHLRFAARMYEAIPKSSLYAAAMLQTLVDTSRDVSDATLLDVCGELPGVSVARRSGHEIRLTMPLQFRGGVTSDWIAASIHRWISCVRRCERLLGAGRRHSARRAPRGTAPQVH